MYQSKFPQMDFDEITEQIKEISCKWITSVAGLG